MKMFVFGGFKQKKRLFSFYFFEGDIYALNTTSEEKNGERIHNNLPPGFNRQEQIINHDCFKELF